MFEFILLLAYWLCGIDLSMDLFGGPAWITSTRLAVVVLFVLKLWDLAPKKKEPVGREMREFRSFTLHFHTWHPVVAFSPLFIVLLLHVVGATRLEAFYLNTALRIILLAILYSLIISIVNSKKIDAAKLFSCGIFFSIVTGFLFLIYVVSINGVDMLLSAKQFRILFNQTALDSMMYGDSVISLNRKLFGYLLLQPFALGAIVSKTSSFLPKVKLPLLAFSWFSLCLAGYIGLLSGSRQFLVSFGLCLLVVLVVNGIKKPVAGLAWFVFLLVLLFVFWDRIVIVIEGFISNRFEMARNSDLMRVDLAVLAWRMFLESPWIGCGPFFFTQITDGFQAHNGWLQLLVDWGLPATAMLLVVVYYLHFRSWKWTWKRRRGPGLYMIGFAVVGLSVAFVLPMALAYFLEYSFWSFLAVSASLCTYPLQFKADK